MRLMRGYRGLGGKRAHASRRSSPASRRGNKHLKHLIGGSVVAALVEMEWKCRPRSTRAFFAGTGMDAIAARLASSSERFVVARRQHGCAAAVVVEVLQAFPGHQSQVVAPEEGAC